MENLLDGALKHLRKLVAFDTQNPPRNITPDGIFAYIRETLKGFDVTVSDHGDGAVSLLAVRGQPRYLFNVHLDTVPVSPQWSRDPHELLVTADKAVGLGACDIKGAAASLLAVAEAHDGPMAMLFSSDEEANDARCIKAFVERYPATAADAFAGVIVGEPTRGKAVLAHRGIQSGRIVFKGKAGHASGAQGPNDSALHQAVRWGQQALQYQQAQDDKAFGGLSGLRFNIGRIEGGIKGNIIAPDATLLLNLRPLPDMDNDAILADLQDMLADSAELTETFRGSPLPAGGPQLAEERRQKAHNLAEKLAIPIGPPVDFWTEAAKFSEAGYTAIVYGPGDIAQAHTADEWVALSELESHVNVVGRMVAKGLA